MEHNSEPDTSLHVKIRWRRLCPWRPPLVPSGCVERDFIQILLLAAVLLIKNGFDIELRNI